MRKSCSSLVSDSVIAKKPVDVDDNPMDGFAGDLTQKQVNRYLTWASATGKFTLEDLNQCVELMQAKSIYRGSGLHFHLASLYLQTGECEHVMQLLSEADWQSDSASKELTWFAALMIFARANGYTIPLSDHSDNACLDYLESHLSDNGAKLIDTLHRGTHLAVVGNAPGANLEWDCSTRRVYFNDYEKNPRLSGDPHIHVITPSWNITASSGNSHLLITGNSIFHRRSRVWRRFGHCPDYQSITCFPRSLWTRLYSQLKAPPSAGLLMICYLAEQEAVNLPTVSLDGFSDGRPQVNHEYDRVPPSTRHDWEAETLLRNQALEEINRRQSI